MHGRKDTVAPQLDPIFANHLAFMAAHRGSVTVTADFARIDGDADFLSSWTPLHDGAALPDELPPVRLVPASGEAWPERLEARGYAPAETLSYMALPPDAVLPKRETPARIRPAVSEAEALAFAGVQEAAFLDAVDPHREWWIDCFRRAASANWRRDDQHFLIAWVDGLAASVLLTVDSGDVAGLYAVATRPEFQRRGLSTALLAAARAHAAAHGRERMVLQAMAGRYAEGFYARLGFETVYSSTVWRRAGA